MYQNFFSISKAAQLFIMLWALRAANSKKLESNRKRIIKGTMADIQDYPFVVSIQKQNTKSHHCGGTLITPQTVLSASHCFEREDGNEFSVLAGCTDVSPTSDSLISTGQKRDVFRFIKYSKVDEVFQDVILLIVAKEFTMSHNVQLVKLPPYNPALDPQSSSECTVVGWGGTKVQSLAEPRQNSDTLMKVNIPLITYEECLTAFPVHPLGLPKYSYLCTSARQKGPYYGDSGGPLICDGKQWGIVFLGTFYNKSVVTEVYTRVDYYYDWIKANQVPKGSSPSLRISPILWASAPVLLPLMSTVLLKP